jgi:hypothetical protein
MFQKGEVRETTQNVELRLRWLTPCKRVANEWSSLDPLSTSTSNSAHCLGVHPSARNTLRFARHERLYSLLTEFRSERVLPQPIVVSHFTSLTFGARDAFDEIDDRAAELRLFDLHERSGEIEPVRRCEIV